MTDLHKQYETMLDRTLVFPPPVMEPDTLTERLNSVDLVNGRKLLEYFVSLNGRDFSEQTTTRVVDHLWVNASPQEKAEYVLLASSVNDRNNQSIQTNPVTEIGSTNIETSAIVYKETVYKADSPVKSFLDIGYFNLDDVTSWWEDEKELYEEDSYDDIMLSFFRERFGNVKDFMDIVDDPHFSQQAKTALLGVYNEFLPIFYDYTPWEWFSWYIHTKCMSTETPAPCPFRSDTTELPENLQHFHYDGTVSKNVESEEVELLGEFINSIIAENCQQSDSKVWYHGTNSVHASSIVQKIDLTVCKLFGHAFGFRRSFYIGENLKYCLIWALKAAANSSVNCALVVFLINEEKLSELQDKLILKCREDSQGDVDTDTGSFWEDIVPLSRNSDSTHNNLDNDPIKPQVQWVEGPSLKKSEIDGNWIPKKDEIIRSFRTDESTQFLQSQLAFIITFKNPRVN